MVVATLYIELHQALVLLNLWYKGRERFHSQGRWSEVGASTMKIDYKYPHPVFLIFTPGRE